MVRQQRDVKLLFFLAGIVKIGQVKGVELRRLCLSTVGWNDRTGSTIAPFDFVTRYFTEVCIRLIEYDVDAHIVRGSSGAHRLHAIARRNGGVVVLGLEEATEAA